MEEDILQPFDKKKKKILVSEISQEFLKNKKDF